MARGTGLPIPKEEPVTAQPPQVINADALVAAHEWAQIAHAGEQIAKTGVQTLLLETRQRQLGYLADQETSIRRQKILLRDQYAQDPQNFENAWGAFSEATIANAEPWAVPHLKAVLGREGNDAFSAVLNERRHRDEALARERMTTLLQQTASDVVAAGMSGIVDTPEGRLRLQEYRSKLDEAVNSRLISPEKAEFMLDETLARAHGETAALKALDVYKRQGFDAAVKFLRESILENQEISLKPDNRWSAFKRGVEAVRLQQAQDKEDRAAIVQLSRDLRARIDSNQIVDRGEIQDTLAALARSGAAAEYRQLAIAAAVAEQTSTWPGMSNLQRAETVADIRAAAIPPQARSAMEFFVSRGWTRAQAAGIVGNLLQESATLNPAQIHDQGTGIGIAGWRLERREALRQFAAARGKPETDFQTQLEFIEHELRTTEAGVAEKLRRSSSAAEAAAAFIDYERPAGWTAANPQAGHGFANRVRNARALAGEAATGIPGEFAGEIARRVQDIYVAQQRKAWPEFKSRIEAGKPIDQDDYEAILYAAALSGDQVWQQEVERYGAAERIGSVAARLPLAAGQSIVDQARQQIGGQVADLLQKREARLRQLATENPVELHIEQGGAPPPPLDLSSVEAARNSIAPRIAIARGIAEQQGTAPASPFRPAESSALAGAISSGNPAQAAVAFNAIAILPDDLLVPSLNTAEIKAAIAGAARSADPVKFNAAMQFMDRVWQRAPETARQIFGEDSIHALMTWQTNLRYLTPEQLAKERERAALDPQIREVRKRLEQDGREQARKYKFDDVVKQFDQSWFITPGPIARALGSQPLPPIDPLTRDAMMGDFINLYGRRYAENGGDKDQALKDTINLMKLKWHASPTNGGRLMLNAPETIRDANGNLINPPVNGTWDWMRDQLEAAIEQEIGKPRRRQPQAAVPGAATQTLIGPTPSSPIAAALMLTEQIPSLAHNIGAALGASNWSYALISDRQTQAEAQAGQRPSYLVQVTDAETGKSTILPRRFAFDPYPAQAKARQDFEWQRARLEQRTRPSLGPSYYHME
jgi:hypothetical protein